jgi:hypothetical protein
MNRRIVHIVCGGINSGKTTFAKYIQLSKRNVYRISIEELEYSIGVSLNDNRILAALILTSLQLGDVIIDGLRCNSAIFRKILLSIIHSIDVDAYAYVLRRDADQCVDEFHGVDEIKASNNIDFPSISEGIYKVSIVEWEISTEPIVYGDEPLMIKPIIKIIDKAKDDMQAVVRSKKKIIKHKLEHGRQNIFRPKQNT